MDQIPEYKECPLTKIEPTLEGLKAGLSHATGILPATSKNFVIFTSKDEVILEPILETLARIQPTRLFHLACNKAAQDYSAQVRIMPGPGGAAEGCSECIQLKIPATSLTSLPHLVRAHLVPGMITDFFLPDWDGYELEVLLTLKEMADRIIFDSGILQHGLSPIGRTLGFSEKLIDLEWIRLGAWKDQVRSVFREKRFRDFILGLDTIVITTRAGTLIPNGALLFGGWLLSRLGFEVRAYGNARYECRRSDGKIIHLEYAVGQGSEPVQGFTFRQAGLNGSSTEITATLVSREQFTAKIIKTGANFEPAFQSSIPLDELEVSALLNRFFLVGESIKNYSQSLKKALECETLRRGFSGA